MSYNSDLLLRRDSLRAALAASAAELDGILAARAGANDDDEHDPEGSTLSSDWSLAAGRRPSIEAELRAVDRALTRLSEGAYGVCLACGRPIPEARLDVRPWAERCVPCATRMNQAQ